MKSNSEHWVSEPKLHFGHIAAYGVSSWDMPDGHRLRREMSRSTILNSIKEMQRWAKKYNVNIERQTKVWLSMAAPDGTPIS